MVDGQPVAPAGRDRGLFRILADVVYVDGTTEHYFKSGEAVSGSVIYLLRNDARNSDLEWFLQTPGILGALSICAGAAVIVHFVPLRGLPCVPDSSSSVT